MAAQIEKELIINYEWCKGCGICVAFCPRKALCMKDGKVFMESPNNCNKCGLCELRCPDYAIFIGGKNDV